MHIGRSSISILIWLVLFLITVRTWGRSETCVKPPTSLSQWTKYQYILQEMLLFFHMLVVLLPEARVVVRLTDGWTFRKPVLKWGYCTDLTMALGFRNCAVVL